MKNGEISIFDKINKETFFKPLVSKYARIYYDAIIDLIDLSSESPIIIYEDALERIQYCINRYNADFEPTEIQRSDIIADMIECGWLTPKKLNASNRYETTITKDCGRIFFYLRDYATAGKSEMANHLYHMKEILDDVTQNNKSRSNRYNSPYQSVYLELIREQAILAVEMIELYNNIDTIIRQIIGFSKSQEMMEFLVGDKLIQKFFDNYWRIKHKGRAGFIKSYICNALNIISEDEDMMRRTAEEMASDKEISYDAAYRKIDSDYRRIMMYLSNSSDSSYTQIERQIDEKIQSYINNLNSKFMYIFGSNGGLKRLMHEYFDLMKARGAIDKDGPDINEAILVSENKMIGEMSYYTPVREKTAAELKPLETIEMSDEEKMTRTEAYMYNAQNKYSQKHVEAFCEMLLDGKDSVVLDSSHLDEWENGCLIAACQTFNNAEEFPFQISFTGGFIENAIMRIKNIKIERIKK